MEIPKHTYTSNPYSLVNDTVYHSVNSGGTCGPLVHPGGSTGSGTATSFNITGLSPNTKYCVAVSDWNSTGQSLTYLWGNFTTLAPLTPPAPTGLTVTGSTVSSVSLSWTNHGTGLVNSTLSFTIGSSCTGLTNASLGGVLSSYTLTGLAPSTTYSFEVESWNLSGGSPPSNCATGTTATPPSGPLAPAFDLYIVSERRTNVTIAWSIPIENLTNVTIWYALAPAPAIPLHPTCPATFVPKVRLSLGGIYASTTVTGLAAGTAYCFGVELWNGSYQNSSLSNTIVVGLGAPYNLHPISQGTTWITVGWTNPNVTGSIANSTIHFGTSSGAYVSARSTGGIATLYNVTVLSPATTYYIVVSVWIGATQTNYSNEIADTTSGIPTNGSSGGGGSGAVGGTGTINPPKNGSTSNGTSAACLPFVGCTIPGGSTALGWILLLALVLIVVGFVFILRREFGDGTNYVGVIPVLLGILIAIGATVGAI